MKNLNRIPLPELLLLSGSGMFCLGLILLRTSYSGGMGYFFLTWNLFLAFLPWVFSLLLCDNSSKVMKASVFGCWLLFFPNAPYILTDLMHLANTNNVVPIWFDAILIMSFAWTALLFGFKSLDRIRYFVLNTYSMRVNVILTSTLLFLSSFGVYLGRFLRWNSWDVLSDPFHLAGDVMDRFINPLSHPRTWAMTILLGVMLNMIYWTMKYLGDHSVVSTNTSSLSRWKR